MRGVATAIETDEVRITSHDPVVRFADARVMAAAPDLARAYLAAVERAEAAERERDALRALVKRYVEAHAARVAHSAREPHDEDWYALLAALNGAVADALEALRACDSDEARRG